MATDAQIAAALAGVSTTGAGSGSPVRSRLIFEQRDLSYGLIGDVSPAFLVAGELVAPGEVSMREGAIVRTASASVRTEVLGLDLDDPGVFIAIAEEFWIPDAAEWVRFNLGLFRIDAYVEDDYGVDGQEPIARLELSDLGTLVSDVTDDVYTVAAAAGYLDAVAALLTARGLSSSFPAILDVVPVSHSWAPKTSGRAIADVLTGSVNYYPIWPGVTGTFTTRERVNPFTESPDVVYSEDDEPRMIVAPLRRSSSKTEYKNRAVVLQNHPKRLPNGYELRENADPLSPISTANLGPDLEEIRAPLVVDLTVAGEWADWYLRDQALRARQAELQTFRDPRRDVRETYQLFYGAEVGTLWRQLAWTYPLQAGGMMSHTIGRIADVTITEPT